MHARVRGRLEAERRQGIALHVQQLDRGAVRAVEEYAGGELRVQLAFFSIPSRHAAGACGYLAQEF